MNTPTAIAAALMFALLVGSALLWQRRLTADLPPRIECRDAVDALARVRADGYDPVCVLGSGSMAPYLPAAPTGRDAMITVVAIAGLDSTPYEAVREGDLCAYRAVWDATLNVLHVAATKDGAGWVMTGIANKHYESPWRMTARDYLGRAAAVYVWPQNAK